MRESFEEKLAKYKTALYFNYCLLAVDTNDKTWFNDSFAQYLLWKEKMNEGEIKKWISLSSN